MDDYFNNQNNANAAGGNDVSDECDFLLITAPPLRKDRKQAEP